MTYNDMILTRKKTILEKEFSIACRNIHRVELREYETTFDNIQTFVVMIYLKTDHEEIEIDFLGKPTNDRSDFEECFDILCNYNGLSSTINRLLIELDSKLNEYGSK